MHSKPNRLAREQSPYLLKHAHNPVDWFPWGKEALAKAKNDNKPIFLSVGYSTCHWCTVMERESFEDEKVAAFINKNFIPIKVDREERPEIDSYYMGAVQAMTGSGGWPLSVFLTPDLRPFYGGTYFPPEPRYGMPSFTQILEFVSTLWKDKREDVVADSERVLKAISGTGAAPGELRKDILDEGYSALVSSFDPDYGGFGRAPKFPVPVSLEFLLRYNYRTRKDFALSCVLKTLDGMAAGGIRDHVGGGFHRYSTDRVWLVPHFEKMLYDNSLLVKLYTEAYQVTGRSDYVDVVREMVRWMTEEMTDSRGGFYSAQDADTTEGEGIYYTWTPDDVTETLGSAEGADFDRLFGVTKTGNFEGRNILHTDPNHKFNPSELALLRGWKKNLYGARRARPRPATDTKILTSWNGLAISGFSCAGSVLRDPPLVKRAEKAAEFILRTNSKNGRLLRRFAGGEAALEGTLEDYAFFTQGLLDLFEVTGEPRWLRDSIRLTDLMIEDLEDKDGGGFFLTVGAEPARLKEAYDGPTPSGNSVAAFNLIRLSELTGNQSYRKKAETTINSFAGRVERSPASYAYLLAALDMLLNGVREVVITAQTPQAAAPMRHEAFRRFVPDKVVAMATAGTYAELLKMSTLLEGRKPAASARAYVCQGFTCKLPADSPETLREQLASR